MLTPKWQLKDPLDAVIFDCDGTLSTIEGIDELARHSPSHDIVRQLTQDAMGKTGMCPGIYAKRLALLRPTQHEFLALGEMYIQHETPAIKNIISILKKQNIPVYIVSAGPLPSVRLFGKHLKIPEHHIYAVAIQFDAHGNYLGFDETSPLIMKTGKREIVSLIRKAHPRLAYVGDGLSDLEVYGLVTRFIGYGGAFYRRPIEEACEFYIKSLSLAPLLPLVLTEKAVQALSSGEKKLYDEGASYLADTDG